MARGKKQRTNRMNFHLNARRHHFIPLVDLLHHPAAASEMLNSAERVDEGGIWGEVFLDGLGLLRRR